MVLTENINTKWLTQITGDPFTDIGGYVIAYFQERYPDKSIFDLIKMATDIYVKDWDNNLHSFFLNSTITHNSCKGQKGIDKTLEYFSNLLEDKGSTEYGYCRITGQKTNLFFAGRENFMMAGSGTFINFHHGFQQGILLSKEVIIRIFFSPLGLIQLSNNVALIQSNNREVNQYFVNENIKSTFKDLASRQSKSIQRSVFSNPANALFDFAGKCISDLKIVANDDYEKSKEQGVTLNLYHFTSFGAKPDIQLYALPAIVFKFYQYCLRPDYKQEWKKFINHHYRNYKFKDANYNDETNEWISSKESVTYDEFKTWRNIIYDKLLKGESILSLILSWSRKNKFNFNLVIIYQQSIRNMDKKTLEKINELADFIIKDNDSIKKNVTRLNGIKSSTGIRQFLITLISKNYKEGNKKPLITLEEYVEYLFPDGSYWRDIRDLLLIAIFQKLHEANIALEIELSEQEQDTETE